MQTHKSLILLSLLFLAKYTYSWTFVMVDDRDMVDTAAIVIEGVVQSRGPALFGGMPATDYTFTIEEILKDDGTKLENTIVVTVPGGIDPRNESLRLVVPGAPTFEMEEKVLLFLIKHKERFFLNHFAMGAYKSINGNALRSIDDGSKTGQVRDFAKFKDWVRKVATSERNVAEQPKDYFVTPVPSNNRKARYNLFTYQGNNVRWFEFDAGNSVTWQTYGSQDGIDGGGLNEVDNAMSAWGNIGLPISYTRSGTTTSTEGLTSVDQINSIVFGDPTDYIPGSFSCDTGGTLAQGGYWTYGDTNTFRGLTFAIINYGDVVVQDGIDCWLSGSSDASNSLAGLLGHELGHSLGLRHSCGDSETGDCVEGSLQDQAIMRATVSDGRGPNPNQDDIDGASYLYSPTGESQTPATVGTASTSTTEETTLIPNFFNDSNLIKPFTFLLIALIFVNIL